MAYCKLQVKCWSLWSSSSVLLYTRNRNCRNGLRRSVSSLHCHYFYFISAGQREMYKLILTAQFMSIPEVIREHLGNFNSQVPMRFNISTEDGESKRWRGFYFPFQEVYFSIEVDLWFCREISWDSESKLISLVINYWLLLTTIYYKFSFSCYTEQKLFVTETITPDNSE